MNQVKKIERVIDTALSEDLVDYAKLLKSLKKKMPMFSGTKRIAAALLKEYLGDISNLDFKLKELSDPGTAGKIIFEDINNGRARLFINIGKNHGISPGDLIREVVKRSGVDGKQIGKIDIHSSYSFIEIPEQYAEVVLVSFDKVKLKGISIVIEPAKKRKKTN